MAVSNNRLDTEPQNEYARSVTVWNDSGGVGKTTVSVNVAAALGRNNRDVLAIDLDPQAGGLTHHSGFESVLSRPKYKMRDVLLNQSRSLNEIVLPGSEFGLDFDVLPAHEDLSEFDTDIDNNIGPRDNPLRILRQGIAEAGFPMNYDVIIIDAPATRGKLVENAICATRNVIIPTEVSPKGVASVEGLYSYVSDRQRKLRRSTNDESVNLSVIAVVPNNGAKNGSFANTEKKALKKLQRNYKNDIVPFHIPSRQILSDSWGERKTLYEFIEDDTVRKLRKNEQILPKMFEMLGIVVEKGTVKTIQEYKGNLPNYTLEAEQ